MTIKERIKQALANMDCETDSIDKVIGLAYYMGREDAAKEICDKASTIFEKQSKIAQNCRYRNLAMKVQGNITCIYHGDYSQIMTEEFGGDETTI